MLSNITLPIKALAVVLPAFAFTGFLLLKSHEKNGQIAAELEQWKVANDIWGSAWQNRESEIILSQQLMIRRDKHHELIEEITNDFNKQIRELSDESGCLDTDLGDGFWLPIMENANKATGAVPDHQSCGTGTDTDTACR